MTSFADRVVLITGAGSGLGRQMAKLFAAEGAFVAALDLSAEPLASLAAELPGRKVACAVGDVTDRAALGAAVRDLEVRLGPTDILIANAGIGLATAADPYDAAAIEAQVRVNLIGVSNSIGAVLPGMLERRSGHLVCMASLASYRGLPRMAGYCASKAGVRALMEAIRVEVAPRGVAVTTVCPGWVRTPLTENIGVPTPYMLEVDDAARRIIEVVRRRKPFVAFPASSARLVRIMRLLPSGPSDWLVRRLSATFARKKEKKE